jgi:hypothetical protein
MVAGAHGVDPRISAADLTPFGIGNHWVMKALWGCSTVQASLSGPR